MSFVLFIFRWVAYALLFAFSTVCLATGLYYLAEIVEEYEKVAKKLIKYAIFVVAGIHVILWISEGLPFLYVFLGLVAHGIYFKLLDQFPRIQITNMMFIVSVVALIITHTVWFRYFTQQWYPFEDVLTFFLLCVWIVPFSFFISLTSAESSLPYGTMSASGEPIDADGSGRKSSNIIVGCFKWLKRKQEEMMPLENFTRRNDYKTF